MTGVLLIGPILSLLVLAAHFFRAGSYVPVAGVLIVLGLLFVRRAWTARIVQALLVLGSIEWVRTAMHLKVEREASGEPAGRMLIILGAVAAVSMISAFLFETRRLKTTYRLLVSILILSLIHPPSARAENCFELASRKLNPQSRVTLHLTDGSAVKGRLEFLDTREKVLLLTAAGEEKREPRTYAMSSIASLDYRAQSSNPGFAVAGGLLGIAAGAVIAGIASGSGSRTTNSVSVAVGGLLGGFVGILVGFALPASVTHEASITCVDPSSH